MRMAPQRLNENGPPETHISMFGPYLGELFGERLGGMSLLEEACHWRWDFEVSKAHVRFPLCLQPVDKL